MTVCRCVAHETTIQVKIRNIFSILVFPYASHPHYQSTSLTNNHCSDIYCPGGSLPPINIYVTWITQYLHFCVWLVSLNITSSWFLLVHVSVVTFWIVVWYIIAQINLNLSISCWWHLRVIFSFTYDLKSCCEFSGACMSFVGHTHSSYFCWVYT